MAARTLDRTKVGQPHRHRSGGGPTDGGRADPPLSGRSELVFHGPPWQCQRGPRLLVAHPDRCEPARAARVPQDVVERGHGEDPEFTEKNKSAQMSADVMVIGAGPAGLATSRELTRAGLEHVVLERGDRSAKRGPTSTTASCCTRRAGSPRSRDWPFRRQRRSFPARNDFLQYLHRYAETFRVPVSTRTEVTALRRANGQVDGDDRHRRGDLRARSRSSPRASCRTPCNPRFLTGTSTRGASCTVWITGGPTASPASASWSSASGTRPVKSARSSPMPAPPSRWRSEAAPPSCRETSPAYRFSIWPSRSRTCRSVSRRSWPRRSRGCPSSSAGRPSCRVPAALAVARSRSSAFICRTRFGRERFVFKRGVEAFTRDGVRFTGGIAEPFDTVILATGYRAALGLLGPAIHTDGCGFAKRQGGSRVPTIPPSFSSATITICAAGC